MILLLGCGKGTESNKAETKLVDQPALQTSPDSSFELAEGSWVPVRRGTLREFVSAVGSLYARQTTRIGPQVSGRVEAVLVDVGDSVKEGQEIVRLDPTFFQIEVQQRKTGVEAQQAQVDLSQQQIKTAQAEVELAKVILAAATVQLNRMKDLWEKPGGETPTISKSEYDDALFEHRQAVANLEAAQSRFGEAETRLGKSRFDLKQALEALQYAQERLQETVMRAPYDGVVTKRFVDPGESVTTMPVTHLVELQETGTLELEFSLPQGMLAQVRPGTPIEFEIEGVEETAQMGEISVVYPGLDEATRSFRCRAWIENADLKFRPGLLAQVRVAVQEVRDALVVPRRALSRAAGGWQVFVFNEGHPVPRVVEIGLVAEDEAEVVSGLTEGDRVLVPKG